MMTSDDTETVSWRDHWYSLLVIVVCLVSVLSFFIVLQIERPPFVPRTTSAAMAVTHHTP